MLAYLESLRDACIALALSWAGVSYEPAQTPTPPPAPQCGVGGASSCGGGGMSKPRFATGDCPSR